MIEERLTATLVELLKIDSRSSAADPSKIVGFMAGQCRRYGLQAMVTGPDNGPQSLVARIPGSGNRRDGLILLAHLDTADWVEPLWQTHPLSATRSGDGRIYGRGAIDCKSLAAIWLHICITVLASGRQPKRDICFIATSDEESGGEQGIKWVLEHTDVTRQCRAALNEGGYICSQSAKHKKIITCQYGEKGRIEMDSGSSQTKEEFIVREQGTMGRIRHQRALHQYRRARELFSGFTTRPDLVNTCFSTAKAADGKVVLHPHPEMNIPHLIAGLRKTGVPGLCKTPAIKNGARASSLKTPLYRLILATAKEYGFSHVFPVVTRGSSDSRHLRDKGITTYGFFPVGLRENIRSIHGHNEHIHRDSLIQAFRMLSGIVTAYCG